MASNATSTPNCQLPTGLSSVPIEKDCNVTLLLLLAFVLGHIATIGTHVALGHRKIRNNLRYWEVLYLNGLPSDAISWTPYSSLATITITIMQCIICAAAIKSSGLNFGIGPLIGLFLTKPRIGWVVVMLSSCFYKSFTDTATDVLFQESVLGTLALPGAIMFFQHSGFGQRPDGCAKDDKAGANMTTNLLRLGSGGLVACGVILLLCGMAMIWKRRFLKKGLGLLAMIPCMGAFVSAWVLWVGFDQAVSDGSFCFSESVFASILAVSITFPVINGLLRVYIGYPRGGYY
ncbi:hypothetical protein FBEOM_10686 [Fusarium beomiforme]|uniref:Uncharacterized protein n=1 Tax=Fusarium beomiforme TaxID=44412 RepID=A0A9P5ABU6_9HYPO|nr:hypothetical protein FBEOM_10686 [Fusarium beomiforme]